MIKIFFIDLRQLKKHVEVIQQVFVYFNIGTNLTLTSFLKFIKLMLRKQEYLHLIVFIYQYK